MGILRSNQLLESIQRAQNNCVRFLFKMDPKYLTKSVTKQMGIFSVEDYIAMRNQIIPNHLKN